MAKRLIIRGVVQGVGYRDWLAAQARALELAGWVRNLADGSVEVVIRGAGDDAARQIIDWARRGPPLAIVSSVDVQDAPDDAVSEAGFHVLPSA